MRESTSLARHWAGLCAQRVELRAFFGRLRKSKFVRNVAIVMTGTAVAQGIGFALSPVISRLFSPTDFGIFGSFGAVAGIVGTLVTLQYSQAIILPKGDADAFNLVGLSCLCTAFVSALCLLACLLAPDTLNGLMKTSGIWALGLLVAASAVTGVNQSFQAWCVRRREFQQTSTSQVVRSVSSSGWQIAAGSMGGGSFGLVSSSVLADIAATINLGRTVLQDWRIHRKHLSLESMRGLAREYRDFPIYTATSSVINSLSLGLPMLLLTHFYGLVVAGAYAFSMRILTTPMGFVLTALRQVLLQKAAEAHNEGRRLMPLYIKITLGLFAVALLPSLLLVIGSPRFFPWIFGPQWELAGTFSSSLIVWLLFMFCNVPAVLFARILRIQRQMFIFDMAVLALRTAALYFGGKYLSPSSAIFLFAGVGGAMNILFILIVGQKLQHSEATRQPINPAEYSA